jgi:hypothetical protein
MITTKKDFERFKVEFLKWVDRFGLKGYEITFLHKKLNDACAEVWANEKAKMASVTLSTKRGIEDCKNDTIEDYAKHEAIHLLLNRIRWLGECRFIDDAELPEEWEKLVRILEKII